MQSVILMDITVTSRKFLIIPICPAKSTGLKLIVSLNSPKALSAHRCVEGGKLDRSSKAVVGQERIAPLISCCTLINSNFNGVWS